MTAPLHVIHPGDPLPVRSVVRDTAMEPTFLRMARRHIRRCWRDGQVTSRDLDRIAQDLAHAGEVPEDLLEDLARLEGRWTP
jgi:hypothetical protein